LRLRAAEVIAALNRHRAFVDLAHIHPVGFWQALALADRDQPPIATHTGVTGVSPHWRNLDDGQIRAIADRGGVIGIMAARNFLARNGKPGDIHAYVAHLDHLIRIGGSQVAAIGTDLDGAIVPPLAMRSSHPYIALVAAMVQAGWPEAQISAVCQGNFTACWQRLRPPTAPPPGP
jgi:membrane dipeptidase